MITYQDIKNNEEINTLIAKADGFLDARGYTEHGFTHVSIVSDRAAEILSRLGRGEREIELARIAGYLHDIGNVVNRRGHAHSGGLMAFTILYRMGMDMSEIAEIVAAIGNHDEGDGAPVSDISAAIILADKTDTRRSRVRYADFPSDDIYDRVEYSVVGSTFEVDNERKTVSLSLKMDTEVGTAEDFLSICQGRMNLCCRAAERLGLSFRLMINDQNII